MGLGVERNTWTGTKNCFDTPRALADQSCRCIVVIGTINRPPFRYSRMFDRGSRPTLLRCPGGGRPLTDVFLRSPSADEHRFGYE